MHLFKKVTSYLLSNYCTDELALSHINHSITKLKDINEAIAEGQFKGFTLLNICIYRKYPLTLARLLQEPKVITIYPIRYNEKYKGYTPLCLATAIGELSIVKAVHEAGNSAEQPVEEGPRAGWTPMHLAASTGSTSTCILSQFSSQVDINLHSPITFGEYKGVPPIMIAAIYGRLDTLKYLIISLPLSANFVLEGGKYNGMGLIHFASLSGSIEMMRYLLDEVQLDVNQIVENNEEQCEGINALYLAIEQGHEAMVDFLLSRGANVYTFIDGKWLNEHLENQNMLEKIKKHQLLFRLQSPNLLYQTLSEDPLLHVKVCDYIGNTLFHHAFFFYIRGAENCAVLLIMYLLKRTKMTLQDLAQLPNSQGFTPLGFLALEKQRTKFYTLWQQELGDLFEEQPVPRELAISPIINGHLFFNPELPSRDTEALDTTPQNGTL